MSHYSPIVAALVTFVLTTLILYSRFGKKIQDIPNERSLHKAPIPRVGGLGLMAGLLCGWALTWPSLTWWLVVPLIMLFVVSLLDDMHNLPVRVRFLTHIVSAALLVTGSGLFSQQGMLAAIIVLLLVVWMTNLYNFMDGSDGLAGGMALFGFSMFGLAAMAAHSDALATLNFTIGAAALAFLVKNFPPAKVFMGDAGSIPLGFLVAGMGLWGWQQGCWSAWFPLLVFSPFIVDASVTLAKRSLRGVKVTEAHREHYYQRAVQMGWGHRNVALIEYGLMLGAGLTGLSALQQAFPWLVLLIWGGIYLLLMLSIDTAWKRFSRAEHVQV